MTIVARCLLVLGLLAAFPALAQQEPQQEPPGRVGRVGIVWGALAFFGPGDSEWSAATVNLPVATGGWFATDPKSRAQLRIGPDTINLAEDTQLNIAELRDGVMQLSQSQGRIGLQLHRPAWRKDQTAEIDVARGGVWLLQPGDYDIDAGTPDRPTRISVFEGSARFVGGGVDKIIKAGERLVLIGADTLTAAIERAEPDDFANWCRDHGIRQDRVAATRRVSPAMTGFEELEEHGEWAEAADYGAVWYPKSLPAEWAPYRAGRWVWVEPWGWNWVDDQPWGFAPFHYGRWAQVNERWGWVPGEFVAQPVYAPALVAFIAQPVIPVAVAADAGPPVGWFPLAPGEVYWPSYTHNPTYIRNVNITNVRINVINQVTTAMLTRRGVAEPPPLVMNQRFVNRPAATIVPAQVVVRSAPVAPAIVRVPDRELRQAHVAALPPPVVARPEVAAAAIATATMPRHGRQPPAAQPLAGAPTAAPTPAQPHLPARPNFAQLARAPRLGHGAAAAIPAALPGAAPAPAAPPAGLPHRPGEAPAATAVIPPLAPHQPPAAANAAPPARPGPPDRPDFANLPRWRPHGGPQQAQSEVPTAPNAGLPVPPSADPAARRHAAQKLAQQRAAAAEAARQQQLGQRAAQHQAIAEQRAVREQARAAQLAQQRAAAEAAGNHQAQQRIAQQQAIAEQRAAREQARAAQLRQQGAAPEAARGWLSEQRAVREQARAAQQAQQRAAVEAARQHQAQQRAAQQQVAAEQAAAQRAAQQQAIAAQQAQQRAAQQAAVQQAAAQQIAAQRAAQQQAVQQAAAQRAAQQQAAQQVAAQRAAQQAQQRAAQQAAAQQAAAQRAAQQQAMAAQQAQQRAAQQQQKQAQKQPPCGGPGQPACPQH